MTTSKASVAVAPRDGSSRPTKEESLRRVEVKLFWRGEAPWASWPSVEEFTFRCLGVRFGSGRWQLHLAETDRRLPGMSTAQRREFTRALREALTSMMGLAVLSFSSDLILERV